jgi:hypothetical protein
MGSTPRTVRLVDIAKEAEVSVSVASSVLNGGRGNTRVAKDTAERILAIAERRNYRPSPTAQQLRGKRSNVFGLLVASAGDPLRSYLVEHLDEEAVKHGCQTLIGNTVVAPGRFEGCLDEFLARGVDGIFCAVHSVFPGNRGELLARCPNTVFYEDPACRTRRSWRSIRWPPAGSRRGTCLRLAGAGSDSRSWTPRPGRTGSGSAGSGPPLAESGVADDALAICEGPPWLFRPDPPRPADDALADPRRRPGRGHRAARRRPSRRRDRGARRLPRQRPAEAAEGARAPRAARCGHHRLLEPLPLRSRGSAADLR